MQQKGIIYASGKGCPFITGDKIPEYIPETILGLDTDDLRNPSFIGNFTNIKTKASTKMAIPIKTYVLTVSKIPKGTIPEEWSTKILEFYNKHGGKDKFQQMLKEKTARAKAEKIYSDSQEENGKQEESEEQVEPVKPKEKPSLSTLQEKIDAAQKAPEKTKTQQTVVEPVKVVAEPVKPTKPVEPAKPTEVKKPLQVPVSSNSILYKKMTNEQLDELGMHTIFFFFPASRKTNTYTTKQAKKTWTLTLKE